MRACLPYQPEGMARALGVGGSGSRRAMTAAATLMPGFEVFAPQGSRAFVDARCAAVVCLREVRTRAALSRPTCRSQN